MANESAEVMVARLEERISAVLEELKAAKDSRKEQYEKMEEIMRTQISIESRVKLVESSLAGQAPTIEEFVTIKHQVQGAGMLGKWLWVAGGFLIGHIFNARETIAAWIQK